jgi:hypothetical protein
VAGIDCRSGLDSSFADVVLVVDADGTPFCVSVFVCFSFIRLVICALLCVLPRFDSSLVVFFGVLEIRIKFVCFFVFVFFLYDFVI